MTDGSQAFLVRLPVAELLESPASWMNRAAFRLGARPRQIQEHLGLGRQGDPDVLLSSLCAQEALSLCGDVGLWPGRKIFRSLDLLDPRGASLLHATGKRPKYRFCPVCLNEQEVPHLLAPWRYRQWLWCPLHHCLMEDGCPHCEMPLVLPFDMFEVGPNRGGVISLAHCQRCGKLLHDIDPILIEPPSEGLLGLQNDRGLRKRNSMPLAPGPQHDAETRKSRLKLKALLLKNEFVVPAWALTIDVVSEAMAVMVLDVHALDQSISQKTRQELTRRANKAGMSLAGYVRHRLFAT